MKIETGTAFVPIELKITLQTEEEAKALYNICNHNSILVASGQMKLHDICGFLPSPDQEEFRVFSKILKEEVNK